MMNHLVIPVSQNRGEKYGMVTSEYIHFYIFTTFLWYLYFNMPFLLQVNTNWKAASPNCRTHQLWIFKWWFNWQAYILNFYWRVFLHWAFYVFINLSYWCIRISRMKASLFSGSNGCTNWSWKEQLNKSTEFLKNLFF